MDIDVQGSRQFAEAFPDSVLIFILPPSAKALISRLEARGTEDPKSLIRRFRSAIDELKAIDLYQYVVVNDEVDSAVAAISKIIDAEELRRSRDGDSMARVKELMTGIQRAIDIIQRGSKCRFSFDRSRQARDKQDLGSSGRGQDARVLNEFPRDRSAPGEKKLTTRALEELTEGDVAYRVVPRRRTE